MTGQPPRLNPVAAPTGAYVQPGRPAPKQYDVNFEALARLSGTLLDYATTQDQRQFQEGQQVTVADAARLDKKLLPALTDPSQDTAAGMEMLKQAGVKGYDNPYVVLGLRQAAAVQQVKNAGLKESLTDPAWFMENSRLYSDNKEAADQALNARVQEFIKNLGPMGGVAQEAAQNEVLREVEAFKAARLNAAGPLFEKKVAHQTALMINTAAENWARAIHGSATKEERAAQIESGVAAMEGYLASLQKTMDPEDAENAVLQGIEAVANELARTEGDEALTYLDLVEKSWKVKTAGAQLRLDRISEALQNNIEEFDRTAYRKREEAKEVVKYEVTRAYFKHRQANPLATASENEKWFYEGDGDKLIKEILAGERFKGTVLDQDLGDLREEMFKSARMIPQESDPQTLLRVSRLAMNNDPMFQAEMAAAEKAGTLSAADLINLEEARLQASRRPSLTDEAKSEKETAMRAMLAEMQDLPPASQSNLNVLRLGMESSYRAHLDKSPGDYAGAQAAAQAYRDGSETYTALQAAKTSMTYAGFVRDDNVAKRHEELLRTSVETAFKDEEAKLKDKGVEIDSQKKDRVMSEARTRLRAELRSLFDEEIKKPEVRALSPLDREEHLLAVMDAKSPKILQSVIDGSGGIGAPPLNPENKVVYWDKNSGWDTVDEMAYTRLGRADERFGMEPVRFNDTMLAVREALSSLKTGGKGELSAPGGRATAGIGNFTPHHIGLSLETALSASVEDGFVPTYGRFSSDDYITSLAVGLPSNATESSKMLYAMWRLRGLSLDEIASGISDFGVPLEKVLKVVDNAPNWVDAIPLKTMPIFASEDEMRKETEAYNKDPDNSRLGKAFAKLGVTKETSGQVLTWQADILKQRGGKIQTRLDAAKFAALPRTSEAGPRGRALPSLPDSFASNRIQKFKERHAVR